MGYYQDLRTCNEHGFVLSPEGTCVRCLAEGATAASRARAVKLAAGGFLALMLLGGGFSYGRGRIAQAAPAPVQGPVLAPPGSVAEGEAAPERPSTAAVEARAASLGTRATLDAWDLELARADAARAAELAAQAAAEKQRAQAALASAESYEVSSTTTGRGRVQTQLGTEDHPSWWQDRQPARRYTYGTIGQQQRQISAAGVTPANITSPNPGAWLPANNGGNFTNRSH